MERYCTHCGYKTKLKIKNCPACGNILVARDTESRQNDQNTVQQAKKEFNKPINNNQKNLKLFLWISVAITILTTILLFTPWVHVNIICSNVSIPGNHITNRTILGLALSLNVFVTQIKSDVGMPTFEGYLAAVTSIALIIILLIYLVISVRFLYQLFNGQINIMKNNLAMKCALIISLISFIGFGLINTILSAKMNDYIYNFTLLISPYAVLALSAANLFIIKNKLKNLLDN